MQPNSIQTITDVPGFTKNMFFDAHNAKASDVHIEPTPISVRIRFRVDGTLGEYVTLARVHHEQLLTHLKVLSNVNVNTVYTPQDGQFLLNYTTNNEHGEVEHTITIRISVFPTVNGDAAVFRLSSHEGKTFSLDALGMNSTTLERVRGVTSRSSGITLITGPIGSGKSTALYSALNEAVSAEKNIVTLEDPVEIRFDTLRQVEINNERGFTFAIGMRSILQQDPDIIMIGEIRDQETAEHAIRAALSGRTVFSSVNTNSSIGTIARLLDMGIEKSMIAYAINGVIATRLIKKNCEKCRVQYSPAAEFCKFFDIDPNRHVFMHGTGCSECNNTGYQGRIGVFEVVEFDSTLRSMIIDKLSMADLQKFVENSGHASLKDDALEKVFAGVITLENAARAM